MTKIKNRSNLILYITTMLNAIYLSYLICSSNSYNYIAIFIITIGLLILSEYLMNKWLKKFNIETLKKKKTSFFLSFFLALIIIGGGVEIFATNYKKTSVKFENTKDIEDYINSISINEIDYKYNGNCFIAKNDPYCNDNIKFSNSSETSEIVFEKTNNIRINFNESTSGISFKDGNNNVKLAKDSLTYEVKSNSYFDYSSYIKIIVSFELICYILYFVISTLFNEDNRSKKAFLLIVVITVIIGLFYIFNTKMGRLYSDSYGYIKYNFENFLKLKFGDRTPLYPLFIQIIHSIFADNYLIWICIFQYIIWSISIMALYKLILLLTKNIKLGLLGSILYALSPTITGWNNVILTESLALSGTLIFIYFIIKYIKNDELKYGIGSIVISLILTFIRPSNLILVLALFVFWILRFIFEKEKIKKDLKCFIGTIISIVIVIIYAILFHIENGIYSLSNAMVRQDLYVNIQEGYYKSSSNKNFVSQVDTALEKYPDNMWTAMTSVLSEYDMATMSKINAECRSKNIGKYINYLKDLIKLHAGIGYYGYSFEASHHSMLIEGIRVTFSSFTFLVVYISFILEFIVTCYLWLKNKKVPWIDLGLFAFTLVITIFSFIGTNGEFMRTSICVVPFTFISYIYLFARFVGIRKD